MPEILMKMHWDQDVEYTPGRKFDVYKNVVSLYLGNGTRQPRSDYGKITATQCYFRLSTGDTADDLDDL